MRVTLLKADTIELIDHAASECYNTAPKDTEEKQFKRVNKICNVYKHNSLLEFGSAVWEIEASAKTLLQMTRHRHASYAVKSTRFTIDKSELIFELTGKPGIDYLLEEWKKTILDIINKDQYSNDTISMMLPMAYQYRWQVQFNYRSLQNFLTLRRHRTSQNEIREVANRMFESLPKTIQDLMENQ